MKRIGATVRVLSTNDLAEGFRRLGVEPGTGLMVHSSLRSFGRTAEGPKTVVDALTQVLTPEGTLMMPSFNHGEPFRENGTGVFDPKTTRCTNGAIPDYFRRQPDVLRSMNPTHSFAAWGKKAREYLKNHHRTKTVGPDSPLGRLWRDGGWCLLIGVGYGPNTFKHVVEVTENVPCLGVRTEAYPVRAADGRTVVGRNWGWRERGCPLSDPPGPTDTEMQKRGLDVRGEVGPSPCILFKLDDCYSVLAEFLHKGLGENPPCSGCPIRPRRCRFTVESDWDLENDRLREGSEAWTYEDGL